MRLPTRYLTLILPVLLLACELVPATATETPTAPILGDTPTPASPEEAIRILVPGPGSRLTSPMSVRVVTTLPTFENVLTLRVLLADGVELVSPQAVIGSGPEGGPLTFEAALAFDVAEEQPAFLQAFVVSPRDGGVTHLASVAVMVMPDGVVEVRPAMEETERLQILLPVAGDTLRGGVVHVEGIGLASFEQTLVIEILNAEGEVIGMQPVLVQAPDFGVPGPFVAEVAYTLNAAGAGRIVVRDISPAHGEDVHRASVEVNLAP